SAALTSAALPEGLFPPTRCNRWLPNIGPPAYCLIKPKSAHPEIQDHVKRPLRPAPMAFPPGSPDPGRTRGLSCPEEARPSWVRGSVRRRGCSAASFGVVSASAPIPSGRPDPPPGYGCYGDQPSRRKVPQAVWVSRTAIAFH